MWVSQLKNGEFMNTVDRFFSKIKKTDSCWIWESDIQNGYGYFQVRVNKKTKKIYAHRYSWIIANGEIPEKLCICHTCDNRICVNPLHMFLGTLKDNRRDCVEKNRQAKGEKIGNAKLTQENVKFIKSMRDVLSLEQLSIQFGVSRSTIARVFDGLTWKHLV